MKRIFLWSVALLLLMALITIAVCFGVRSQVITLKDGTKLTFVGVTYGTHHVFKGILGRGRTSLNTSNETAVVWIEAQHKGNGYSWQNYQVYVYDPDNTACVATWQSTSKHIKAGADVQAFTLNAYPRRDSKMILRVGSWGNGGGMKIAKGEFVIPNPGPRSFTEWTPDPIPDTQSDGDLSVTLTKCQLGGRGVMFNSDGNSSSKDPMHRGVELAFHCEQNGTVATNWHPVSVETSDATGNKTGMSSWSNYQHDTNDDPMITYQWGLWPNEPAWKLRVEMSRTSGFTDEEMWGVTNVPIHKGSWQNLWNNQGNRFGRMDKSQTNSAIAIGTIGKYSVSVFPAIQITDQNWGQGHPGGVRVVVDPEVAPGYRLSIVVSNERGRNLQTWGPNGGGNSYISQIQDLGSSKSLNLTIAIHKSRYLEYTVKPEIASTDNSGRPGQ
jgi:hypothetical protein